MSGRSAPYSQQAGVWPAAWLLVVLAGIGIAALRQLDVAPLSAGLALVSGIVVSLLLLRAGLIRHRPQASALACLAIAVLLGTVAMALRPIADGPAGELALLAADVGTNIAGGASVLLFARGFGRADLDAWLDAGSIGLLISLLIYDSVVGTAQVSGLRLVADFSVATLDAALFAVVVRFILRFQRSPGLLVLALMLAAAIGIAAAYEASDRSLPLIPLAVYEGVWLLAYVVIGAATLHPKLWVRQRAAVHEEDGLRHIVRSMLVAVGIHTGSGVVVLVVIGIHVVAGLAEPLPVMLFGLLGLLTLGTARSVRVVRRLEADIAARYAAEASLRASEHRYQRLAEVAPVGILEIDAARRILSANPAWTTLVGGHGTTADAATMLSAVHPADADRVMASWDAALRHVAPIDEEHRIQRPDGSTRWVRTAAVPLRDDDGGGVGWVAAISDVTDLIAARTTAEERGAIAVGLQDQSPVGIEVYGTNGRTLRRNDAQRRIRELAGLPDEPVDDVRLDPLTVALGQGPAIQRALAGEADAAEPESVQLSPVAHGGQPSEVWVRIRWFSLKGEDSRVIALISFTEDVTSRVQAATDRAAAEVAVRETAKLEALGVLAGGIAHDFNNILVAILGHIGFARDSVAAGSPVAADLASAEQAAHRAADLARQMLAYSGHGTIQVGPMSLNAAAHDMGDMVGRGLAPGARIVFDLDENLPATIADATQIRQIVLNLMVNASEALAGRAGTITIRTGLTTLGADDPDLIIGTAVEPGTYLVLQVADTGAGMDEATRARIFEPFYSTKKAGRGLGLAATLGIVKGHDGAIRVRSTPGEGTSFEILLRPDGGVVPPPPSAPAAVAAPPSAAVILLVDDEDAVRLIARRILERAGYVVVEAIDGPEAIERFAASPESYVAVVLDLALPTMGGRAVLAELRGRRASVPVVICSGWAADDVGDTLRASPHTVFLQKPFTPSALTGAVELSRQGVAATGVF